MKLLLVVMAVVEACVGLGLLVIPALAVSTLLATPLDTSGGLVAGRLAGAGLTTLALACWNARNGDRGGPASGVVAAMSFYNAAAVAIAVYAAVRLGIQSPFIWPVIVLHIVLFGWCLMNLRITRGRLARAGTAGQAKSDA